MANINSVDLNLLIVFNALGIERNTTKAAKRLHLSQPAISHALARLRNMFSDPLFVRASKGLVPTRRALELMEPVTELLSRAETLLRERESFDPAKEKREFRISTTDYFEVVVLPELLRRLKAQAPGIRLILRPTTGDLPKEALESGTLDLAIAGFYGELPEGYYQQLVFKDDFVCVGRKGHPSFKGELTMKKYGSSQHILISPDGDMKSKSAAYLKKHGYEQEFALGTFSFLSPGWNVLSTDLLLTCPRKLGRAYQRYLPIELRKLPFEMNVISVMQIWQNLHHRDPAHIWLRALIKEVCSDLDSGLASLGKVDRP